MAMALSLNGSALRKPAALRRSTPPSRRRRPWSCPLPRPSTSAPARRIPAVGSPGEDSPPAPSEMSLESAHKLLGVAEGSSFDVILRAKDAVLASCKGDDKAAAQVEEAYDMLLMHSLSQRRAGKVANSSIRYADVKSARKAGTSTMPQWMQATLKNVPVSVQTPSSSDLGIQSCVYGALMALTYASGSSSSFSGIYTGPDAPGILLASGCGASLYFLTKKNISLGKAALITIGGLVIGAAVGSAVESWLQVDVVPFIGITSPAAIVSELILFSQLLASLYLR